MARQESWNLQLVESATEGNLADVKRALENGADVNKNHFPLASAIKKGHLDIVKFLVENGADIFLRLNDSNNIALSYAVQTKYQAITNFIQRETIKRVNLVDEDGKTQLIKAVEKKSLGLVKILTESGAQTWLAGKNGVTPLTIAVMNSNADIVKFLLENGGKCTVPLAFSCAIEQHLLEMVKILVEQGGANVNMSFRDDSFPLMKSVDSESFTVFAYLIEKGAAVTQIDKNGDSVLLRSVEKSNYKMFKQLIDNKADIHQVLPSKKNILSVAATKRCLIIVVDLIQLGADVTKSAKELKEYANCDDNFFCYLSNQDEQCSKLLNDLEIEEKGNDRDRSDNNGQEGS